MPDESCRNCGTGLKIQSTCSECREPIQQICPKCRYATLERIHFDCTMGLETICVGESHGQTPMVTSGWTSKIHSFIFVTLLFIKKI